MKNIYITILFIFASITTLFASPRTIHDAKEIAQNYQIDNGKFIKSPNTNNRAVKLVYSHIKDENESAFFVFKKNEGFMIVSGDDNLPEVIAYADKGSFDWDTAPIAFKEFMLQYTNTISEKKRLLSKDIKSVSPLLKQVMWNQDAPYNGKCPKGNDKGKSFQAVVGCTATALSQILYYYKYPKVGTGIRKSYVNNRFGMQISSDFNITYDWNNMLPYYVGNESQKQKDAVAQLCYDTGVLLENDFGPMSGAFSHTAIEALPKYLNYDTDISYLLRHNYSYKEWTTILKEELDAKRPILYVGFTQTGGGHSYVCDGYKGDYFHLNWGWGGMCNGYFYLYQQHPESHGIGGSADRKGFNYLQSAILSIHPPDNQDGVGSKYCLVYSNVNFTTLTYNKNQSNTIKFPVLSNQSKYFNGKVNAYLYNNATKQSVGIIGTTSDLSIALEREQKMVHFDLDFSTITDGRYYLLFESKASNSNETYVLRNLAAASIDTFSVSVIKGKVTISKPFNHFEIQCKHFQKQAPVNNLYKNSPAIFSFELKNAGTHDFASDYCVYLNQEDKDYVLHHGRACIVKGQTKKISLTVDIPDLKIGKCQLVVSVNNSRLPYPRQDHKTFQDIFTLDEDILVNPDGTANFVLNSKIYFEGAKTDNIHSDNALLKIPIQNLGGLASTTVWAIVWDNIASKAQILKNKKIVLTKNEKDTVIFDYTNAPLVNHRKYTIFVEMNKNNQRIQFPNKNHSILTFNWLDMESSINGNVLKEVDYFQGNIYNPNHKQIYLFDIHGHLLLQSNKEQINIAHLINGVYMLSDGFCCKKIIK